MVLVDKDKLGNQRGSSQEQYIWFMNWEPRFREMVKTLNDMPTLSYAQLLAHYAAALIPRSEGVDERRKKVTWFSFLPHSRPQQAEFKQTVTLDFLPLRRVRILDLQIQLREDTDYVCFGRFGKDFEPSNLAKIQNTLKEYGMPAIFFREETNKLTE
jgi:hypothetical protein